MAVIPNSCRECNQHDCVNHQFVWFMKNNPNINSANSVNPACPLLKEVSQEPIIDKIRAEIVEHADRLKDSLYGDGLRHAIQIIDKYKAESKTQESDIEKRKPCINYEDGCEEWAGCPCVYYKGRK